MMIRYTYFLRRYRQLFIILGGIYAFLVVFLVALGRTPFGQRSRTEKCDLTPFQTNNVRIQTDNETLSAWFTFSDPFYATHRASSSFAGPSSSASAADIDENIRSALRTYPTVLFLHGGDMLGLRGKHHQAFAARLQANVLTPDYRGVADSTGTPSEADLVLDALAAWDWLRARGALPLNVLVVGSSLRTSVTVQFGRALKSRLCDPHRPRGVVLLAPPFSNVGPMFSTPHRITFASDHAKRYMFDHFDTIAKIVTLDVPVLIVHPEQGQERPLVRWQTLFDTFLGMPAEIVDSMAAASKEVAERMTKLAQDFTALQKKPQSVRDVGQLGHEKLFLRDNAYGDITFLRTLWNGHDEVGLEEGVQDYMSEMFCMTCASAMTRALKFADAAAKWREAKIRANKARMDAGT